MIDSEFLKDIGEDAAACTVHNIDGKLLPRLGDEFEIGKCLDRGNVGGLEICLDHIASLALNGFAINQRLDFLHNQWRCRTAIAGLEFHAIPIPWIVARRDHYAAGGTEL